MAHQLIRALVDLEIQERVMAEHGNNKNTSLNWVMEKQCSKSPILKKMFSL